MKVRLICHSRILREFEGQAPDIGDEVSICSYENKQLGWPSQTPIKTTHFSVQSRHWIFDETEKLEVCQVYICPQVEGEDGR